MSEPIQQQTITIDDFVAYDFVDPPADVEGNTYVWQNIEGWFGGIGVRGAPIDRPMSDGAFDGPAPFEGRTVTISGTLLAKTRGGLQHGLDRLAGILSGQVRRATLVVDETQRGASRQAEVRLGGPTMIDRLSTYQADWSLVLFSPDPLRYGTSAHTITILPFAPGSGRTYNLIPNRHYGANSRNGIGTVTNAGNTNTPLVITFIGPCTNPGLRIVGGDQIQYMGSLSASEQVVIDTQKRTVLLNGANRRRNLSAASRWISAPPGSTQVYHWVDNVNKTGSCLVQWRDAWS